MSSDRGPISSGKQEGHRHVRIHPECTLCGSYFDVGAPMVSLLGDRFNATCRVIESSTFPIAIYCNQRNGTPWTFCQFPKCAKCAVEQESVTVHRDCFQIFLQETSNHPNVTAYNLWHATHARYPWRGFWPLPLTTLDENAASVAMAHAAANWRLPLDLLPNELLLLICENLRDSVFWRYILVKEFVRSLIANAEDSLTTAVELSQVQSWRRGESPKIGQSSKRSYIRLTMDSFGIYEIERLPHMPQKSALRSETHAYVVDSARQLGRISMTFKYGLARLYPPKGTPELRCWDTPGPPMLPGEEFLPDMLPSTCSRLGTIETEQSFGITFFISSGQIAAIHAHTIQAPSAFPCYQRINPVKKRWVAWIFVPIRGGIEKFGFRTPLLPAGATLPQYSGSLLLQMKTSGEVVLGPYMPYGKDLWIRGDCTTMMHGISRMGAVYPFVATSEEKNDSPSQTQELFYENPMSLAPPFEHAYFSYAELENVRNMEVYHDKKLRICRGVIVRYDNGAERSLGQCRIGVDSVRVFEEPQFFCYKKTKYLRQGTRVERDSIAAECNRAAHHHGEGGWTCCRFPSRLEWWFTSEESRISFTPGREGYR